MKNFILFSILMLYGSLCFGQDASYSGPAKVYVNNYKRDIVVAKQLIAEENYEQAKSKITSLERYLKMAKESDAKYDTSWMQTEIDPLKAQVQKGIENSGPSQEEQQLAEREERRKNQFEEVHIKNDLHYLFVDANLQVGHNNLEFAQQRLDDYKAKTRKILSSSSNLSQDYIKYISRFNMTMDLFYDRNKSLLSDINNVEEYQPAFMELQLYEAYWDAARSIYPNQAEFKTAYDKIVSFRKSIGSLENVSKVAEKNAEDKIASRKMEAPATKDADLEKFVEETFNASYQKKYGKTLKVVLTQSGWTSEYNSLTGALIGRYKQSQLAYKGTDGKCYLLSGIVYIHEDLIGSGFGNRKIVYDGLGGQEMLCDNI